MTIILPQQLNATALLQFVTALGKPTSEESVELDFSKLQRITPAGLVLLTATITRWHREHRMISFPGLTECSIYGYLQRMNFLKYSGIDMPEEFTRHNAQGKFMPLQLIESPTENLGRDMAGCVAPGGEEFDHANAWLYDMVFYVLTEAANNVRQHSRGIGYAAAQVNRSEGLVRLAIADNGHGIRNSFVNAGFTWASRLNDKEAIQKALEPKMSSKGSPHNEGVGLTLITELAQMCRAWLLIVSGSGCCMVNRGAKPLYKSLPDNGFYTGTICLMTFPQRENGVFQDMLYAAKTHAGLLHSTEKSGKFIL
jgi:hypothetical protein